jgi:hypothetical protein
VQAKSLKTCCDCGAGFVADWAVQKRCSPCAEKAIQPKQKTLACADCGKQFPKFGRKKRCDECQTSRLVESARAASTARKKKDKQRRAQEPEYREEVLKAWRVRDKNWRARNPEKRADQKRRHRERNRAAVREYKRKYDRRTRASDPVVRLVARTRSRIAMALRAVRQGKAVTSSGQAFQLLGCTAANFASHLESQFARGMNWETFAGRNGWHVDHIYPIAAADLSDEPQRLAVFNWRNCRPQWGIENLKKGATVTEDAAALFWSLVKEFQPR